MAFASGAPPAGYSTSALRFGLINIKPIEIVETIKRCGIKFRRISRTFESLEPSKSFTDLVTFQNEAIINSIEIPKWFDADKLVEVFSRRTIENYEKDTELKKAVEDVRQAERKGRPLLSFIQFIRQRVESEKDRYLETEAERFLRSNFPLSFYNKLVVFDKTYYNFLKILEGSIRLYEFRASYSRSFKMYNKKIAEMQKNLSPVIDHIDTCVFSYFRLKKYVAIWNSKDYEELFSPSFLDFKNVEFSEYENLYNDYSMKLRETREFLLRYNPEFLRKEFDSKEFTTSMFGKLVMIPSSSLNLER